jgi:hypothetical protein
MTMFARLWIGLSGASEVRNSKLATTTVVRSRHERVGNDFLRVQPQALSETGRLPVANGDLIVALDLAELAEKLRRPETVAILGATLHLEQPEARNSLLQGELPEAADARPPVPPSLPRQSRDPGGGTPL